MIELVEMFPYLIKLFVPMLLIVEFIKSQLNMKGRKIIIISAALAFLAVFSLGSAVYGSILNGIWAAVILTAATGGGVDLLKDVLPLVGTLKTKTTRKKKTAAVIKSI